MYNMEGGLCLISRSQVDAIIIQVGAATKEPDWQRSAEMVSEGNITGENYMSSQKRYHLICA